MQLRAYDWPGNVRELRNVLERVLLVNEGHELTPRCMSLLLKLATNRGETHCAAGTPCPAAAPAGERGPEPGEPWLRLDDLEREHLQKTLEHTLYNQTAAAELLGITRRVLARLMRKHGLDDSAVPIAARRRSPDLAETADRRSPGFVDPCELDDGE